MELRKTSGLLACATLLALALLSGCGGTSTTTTIPATASIFSSHSVVFRNNSTMTMGYNGFGQLGTGSLTNTGVAVLVPIPALGHVDGAAAGGDHTLAFAFSNFSSVYAWGSNYHGQIGPGVVTSGTSAFSALPTNRVKISPLAGDPQPKGRVNGISAGSFHSLAVMDGHVFTWGYNGFGQLGDRQGQTLLADDPIPSAVTQTILGTPTPLTNIAQASAGGAHSLALRNDGVVFAWGDNTYGQLGDNPANLNKLIVTAPQVVTFPAGTATITRVIAGGAGSYALDADGNLWAWGYNGQGQLGQGLTAQQLTTADNLPHPTPVKVKFPAGTVIVEVAAGLDHVVARDSNNSVWAWGYNEFGQVGNGVAVDNPTPFQLTQFKAGGSFVGAATRVLAYGNCSLAFVPSQNAWYGWGDNGFGQLGVPVTISSSTKQFVPQKVQGF